MLIRLTLENFKCHRHTAILFSENINGIFGANGSGKTSILEGIVFALFGEKKPSLKLSDLISHHEIRLKTTLEFYGVDRKKYTIKRSLKRTKDDKCEHKAYLYEEGEDTTGPMSKCVLAEVEEEVVEKLGITKAVFMNAIYVQQGRLKDLIQMIPSDRSKLLDELLGLEDLENARRDMLELKKWAQENTKSIEKEKLYYEAELQRIDEFERDVEDKKNQIRELNKDANNKKTLLEDITTKISIFERYKSDKDTLEKEVQNKNNKIELKTKYLEINELDLKKSLAAEDEIKKLQKEYEEYKVKKSEYERQNRRFKEKREIQDTLNKLNQRKSNLEVKKKTEENEKAKIDSAENEIKTLYKRREKLELLNRELIELQKDFIPKKQLDQEQYSYKNEKKATDDLISEIQSLTDRYTALKSKISEYEIYITSKTNEIQTIEKEANEKLAQIDENLSNKNSQLSVWNSEMKTTKEENASIEKLDSAAECPLCKQKLDDEHIQNLRSEFSKKISELSEKIDLINDEIESLKNEKNTVLERVKALNKDEIERKTKELSDCKIEITRIEEKMKTESQLRTRSDELRKKIEVAETKIDQMVILKSKIDEKTFELKEYQNVPGKIEEYERTICNKDTVFQNLEKSKRGIEALDVQIESSTVELQKYVDITEESIEMLRKDIIHGEIIENNILRLKKEIEKIPSLNETKKELIASIEEMKQEQKELLEKVKEIELKYDHKEFERLTLDKERIAKEFNELNGRISELQKDIEKLDGKLKDLDTKKLKYLELQSTYKMWSKKTVDIKMIRDSFRDIQPYLRSEFINAINIEANDFFLDLRTKDRLQGVFITEDYQIIVDEDGNKRSVDFYSGGEQIIIAIALRSAIARVFSGASLLILDEPTVELDDEHIESLSEVISTLSEIDQVIMISHDEKLVSATSTIITLSMDKDGISTIS